MLKPMKKILLLYSFLACAALETSAALNVVATLPDFGALAEVIGGPHVSVTTIARGTEDPHFVDARPSFVRVLNRADVLLEGGAELELGWLPPLVNSARNSRILADAPGHVIMSRGIELLDLPTGPIDRSMGDVHPAGNPHYWLDPENGRIMARHLVQVFAQLDPPHRDHFEHNFHLFSKQLDEHLVSWKNQMEPFAGTKIVTYHKTYDYFARRFGLKIVAQLEPKPGLEPSPRHINELIPRMKSEGVKLILLEPNRPRRTAAHVAEAAGAKMLVLPAMVGGEKSIKTYFDLFDYATRQIGAALRANP